MSIRNIDLTKPWVGHINKFGGNWEYQIRTVEPHNQVRGLGTHIADVNKHLYPQVEELMHLLAAAPVMQDALILAEPTLKWLDAQFRDRANESEEEHCLQDADEIEKVLIAVRTALATAQGAAS
jgi:hypothetical protein